MKRGRVNPLCNLKRCYYCQAKLTPPDGRTPTSRTVDHVIPKSVGGKDIRLNRVWCCLTCNQNKKDNLPPSLFIETLGIRLLNLNGFVEIQWRDPRTIFGYDYEPDLGPQPTQSVFVRNK